MSSAGLAFGLIGREDGVVGCLTHVPVDSIFTLLARDDPVPSFPENITTFTS